MENIFLKRLELTERRHFNNKTNDVQGLVTLYIYTHTYFHAAFPIYTVQTHTTSERVLSLLH